MHALKNYWSFYGYRFESLNVAVKKVKSITAMPFRRE